MGRKRVTAVVNGDGNEGVAGPQGFEPVIYSVHIKVVHLERFELRTSNRGPLGVKPNVLSVQPSSKNRSHSLTKFDSPAFLSMFF